MKRIVGGFLVVAVSAALLVLCPTSKHGVPVVHAQSGCSVASLSGNYGFIQPAGVTHSGKKGKGANVPWQFIGVATFDGAGDISAAYSGSLNGQVFTNQTTAGTYTVNSDCTGSVSYTSGGAAGSTYNFVIADGGNEIFAVDTGTGDTASVILKKQ